MLFYNLDNLIGDTECDPNKTLYILKFLYYKVLPKNSYSPKINKQRYVGVSFILNPEPLFNDKSTDILYKIQYIKLAGMRSYFEYKTYKIKHLNRSFYPDILLENIKRNPLLDITDTNIYFTHEESYHGSII